MTEKEVERDVKCLLHALKANPQRAIQAYNWFLDKHADWYPVFDENGRLTGLQREEEDG